MCTSIAAGRLATADGNVLIARNEDYPSNCWCKHLKYRECPQYAQAECLVDGYWRLGNGMLVPVPEKRYAYCSMPDAEAGNEASAPVGDGYYFEERGINTVGVAVSATNSMGINDRALECDPTVSPGVEESIIATLILPQVESAKDGVRLLGEYVEKYGAAEADGILFADADEVWYMEIVSGHHWIAVRVPDDKYLAVANCMRIRGVDLHDKDNVLHSDRIAGFVRQNGLLASVDEHAFDSATAFGYYWEAGHPENKNYNTDRLWLAQKMLTPSLSQPVHQTSYPLFLSPDVPVSVESVKRVLRGTYKGTELEGIADRPIGAVRTAESHIMSLDRRLPESLRGIIWQAVSTPLGSPYLPVFGMQKGYPLCYDQGGSDYDEESAYWAFRSLFTLTASADEDVYENVWRNFEAYVNVKFAALHEVLATKGIPEEEKMCSAVKFSCKTLEDAVQKAKAERALRITRMASAQKDGQA